MKPKVHSFKFTRTDLIHALKKKGVIEWEVKVFDQALKQISLSKAVEYVLDNNM